jgi:hypothetical protein
MTDNCMRTLLLVTLMFIHEALDAQPLITDANQPQIGDVIGYLGSNLFVPVTYGEDQIWDLSTLNYSYSTMISFIDPISIPGHELFPTATIATMQDSFPIHDLYRVWPGGMEFMGQKIGDNAWIALDPHQMMVYPCGFNTSWTDNYSFISDGEIWSDTTIWTANGHGTLILPQGAFENVLLLSGITALSWVSSGWFHESIRTTHRFLHNDLPMELAGIWWDQQYTNGELQYSDGHVRIRQGSVGINDLRQLGSVTALWPNPASNTLRVHSMLHGPCTITVYDTRGVMVLTIGSDGGTASIDVRGLPPGSYQLRVANDQGSAMGRFIME